MGIVLLSTTINPIITFFTTIIYHTINKLINEDEYVVDMVDMTQVCSVEAN